VAGPGNCWNKPLFIYKCVRGVNQGCGMRGKGVGRWTNESERSAEQEWRVKFVI